MACHRWKEAIVKLGWFDENHCAKGTDNDLRDEGMDDDHCGEDTDEDCEDLCTNCCRECPNCCSIDNSKACVLLGGLSGVRYLKLQPSCNLVWYLTMYSYSLEYHYWNVHSKVTINCSFARHSIVHYQEGFTTVPSVSQFKDFGA